MLQFNIRKRWLKYTTQLSVVVIVGWPVLLNAACSETVSAAAHAQVKIATSVLDEQGYRATAILWDALLQKRWAQVVDCHHPEWPAVSVLLEPDFVTGRDTAISRSDMNARKTSVEPLVHVGDVVRLWRQEESVRIEIQGVAEESGVVGARIRVRLKSGFGDKNGVSQRLYGLVCSHEDIEL